MIKRLVGLWLLFVSTPVLAYELGGAKWDDAETDFYVDIKGVSGNGVRWNDAFIAALDEWSEATPFNFVLRPQYRDPCAANNVNSVDFSTTVCGSSFGENTLAVTLLGYETDVLGSASLYRAAIIVNQNLYFEIFDGSLGQYGSTALDFRRVALHELGHVLGLGHEQSMPAIMSPKIGNIDRLQPDDITGVTAIYNGLSNCQVNGLNFGVVRGRLAAGDCTIEELTLAPGDDSFVDVYKLVLDQPAEIVVEMLSGSLDSVILLANEATEIFVGDDYTEGSCNSRLNYYLPAGSYFVLANTFVNPEIQCNTTGPYQLKVSYQGDLPQSISSGTSLLGSSSNATFSGGIRYANGWNFGSRFSSIVTLDINASIQVDVRHWGQPGFIMVAAEVDGQLLVLNNRREFVEYDGGDLVYLETKNLNAVENINIANNLMAAAMGYQTAIVNIFFGYGLMKNSQEVYFNDRPLNLLIDP